MVCATDNKNSTWVIPCTVRALPHSSNIGVLRGIHKGFASDCGGVRGLLIGFAQ